MTRMPEPRELDPVAAGLIRASLTGDKFATDRILTRAVEARAPACSGITPFCLACE
jgi:hypothetical protein